MKHTSGPMILLWWKKISHQRDNFSAVQNGSYFGLQKLLEKDWRKLKYQNISLDNHAYQSYKTMEVINNLRKL